MHGFTLESIIKELRNASPYQKKQIAESYKGQKINWELKYSSILESNKKDSTNVGLSDDVGNMAYCEIKTEDFPLIKILPKHTPLRIAGTINEVGNLWVDIKDAYIAPVRDEKGQIYFPYGSRSDLLAFLATETSAAKEVKISDPYIDNDVLMLLEQTVPNAHIKLIGGDKISNDFIEKAKAFKIYFSPRALSLRKTNVAHARFWIIDAKVYHVDASLKNGGGNKATMVHLIEDVEAENIKKILIHGGTWPIFYSKVKSV